MNYDDMTNEELARALNIDPQQISGGSRGRMTPEEQEAYNRDEQNRLDEGLSLASKGSVRPEEDVSSGISIEPDRPQFGKSVSDWQNMADGRKSPPEPQVEGDSDHRDFNTKEIKDLISQLEAAQGKNAEHKDRGRAQAYALNAGEVVRAGFLREKPNLTPIPGKKSHDYAKDVEQKARLSNDLQTGEEKRQNPDYERALKQYLAEEKAKEDRAKQKRTFDQSDKQLDVKNTQQNKVEGMKEGGRNARNDKLIRAGLAGKILGMYSSAGKSGAQADADYANKQATYQIPNWDQRKPNSPTDHSRGAELAGAEDAFWQVGHALSAGLRKNGAAFPQSTEWKNVAGDYMALNEALNFLNHNGVMNFKDKENNDIQIGNAQELIQYVTQNGPEVLDHAMETMRTATDARMNNLGYARHSGEWNPKTPSGYIEGASGGGGSNRSPISPGALKPLGNWVDKGGEPPIVAGPNAQPPETPAIPTRQKKVVEQYGNIVKYDDGTYGEVP